MMRINWGDEKRIKKVLSRKGKTHGGLEDRDKQLDRTRVECIYSTDADDEPKDTGKNQIKKVFVHQAKQSKHNHHQALGSHGKF
jgi:hypothetical protein